MKRKPNNGAGPEPREAAGAADPGGAGEGSAGGTSGQSVPKSKFRQKSNQEKAAASKLRMEKRGEKLDRAKEKLAKQKPPKKPGPVRRVGRVASGSAHSFVHGKIYENEHENVGIEGAHRSELVGESALRHGSRFVKRKIREHPAKAVQKAESRHIKATADYQYRATVEAHPEMQKGGAVSRYIQKQKIKRQKGVKPISIKITPAIRQLIGSLQAASPTVDDFLLPIVTRSGYTGERLYMHIRTRYSKYQKYLRLLAEELGIDFHLTSYVSRHTAAMTLQRNHIPREVISQMLGHADLETTNVYLDGFDNGVINEAAKVL